MDLPPMNQACWDRAIRESWLICPQLHIDSVRRAICSTDYLCFAITHNGTVDPEIADRLKEAAIPWMKVWCFYKEPDRAAAIEPCVFVSAPRLYQTMDDWIRITRHLKQRHFLSGMNQRHWLYAWEGNTKIYAQSEIQTPKPLTHQECVTLIQQINNNQP
jgi:hypothetical protein